MVKMCIFDLDGTLLNTLPTITYYINITLEEFGFDKIGENDVRYMVGNGSRKLMERVMEKVEAPDELFEKMHKYYCDKYDSDTVYLTRTYDGIPELLAQLKTMGIKTCVLSNKPDYAAKEAVRLLLGDLVDEAYGGREGVMLKPSSQGVELIMESMGTQREECIFIGDSSVDIKTGKNSGIFTIGVDWGFRGRQELVESGADLVVSETFEILDYIEKR